MTTIATVGAAIAPLRSFDFDARVQYAPLLQSLPNHTAIYHEWPPEKLRKTLPNYISAALVSFGYDGNDFRDDPPLIGPPIHVQAGDMLSVNVKNSLSTTGLSIHWHGFEMENALEYDGVVGITQCPISPYTSFKYEFEVEEVPGTYWWHTHSGTLGIHAINAIHGPLIVHPAGEEKRELVDRLNGKTNEDEGVVSSNIDSPWYYGDERILFFKDGYIEPDAIHLEHKLGGLGEAVTKDDSGHTVGTVAWEFGTCNGRMREIVPVTAGETYKFRLINGGVHYGLRVSVADLKMRVLAADSEPVEPVVVDEVFMHVAERFDVEIDIPSDWSGQFWIKADTVESAYQGYQNGVRTILDVSPSTGIVPETAKGSLFSYTNEKQEVPDPYADIRSPIEKSGDHLILNCFERKTFRGVPYGGKCLPITVLSQSEHATSGKRQLQKSYEEDQAVVHFIDSHFQPPPQHAHFIRFDDGHFLQHVNPIKAMLDPTFGPGDMHPNVAELHVPSYSTVILVWRTTSLMDHPMHLHGLKMEIIDIAVADKQQDCTLSKCNLNSAYKTHDDVRALAESASEKPVLKDTFIIPAGGAVMTRIYTQEPSLWFSHCHIEMHHFDGMAFVLNVGNYSSSNNRRTLPDDFPSCNTPFIQTQKLYPSCDCYENPNTIMGNSINSDYKCSRSHLCHHVHSQAANLDEFQFTGGDDIHSAYRIPGWGISGIAAAAVCVLLAVTKKTISIVWASKGQPTPPPEQAPVPVPKAKPLLRRSSRSFRMDAKDGNVPQRALRAQRTSSFRSFQQYSTRSLNSSFHSVDSDSHRCTDSITASFINRKMDGSSAKDFIWTYTSDSGKWADSELDRSLERDSDHSSVSPPPVIRSVATGHEQTVRDTHEQDNKVNERERSQSIISCVTLDSVAEMEENMFGPQPGASNQNDDYHQSTKEEEVAKKEKAILGHLRTLADQNGDGHQSTEVSMSDSQPDVEGRPRLSRRVSFSNDNNNFFDTADPIGGIKNKTTRPRPVLKRALSYQSNPHSDDGETKGGTPRLSFSEQLQHETLTQYKIYRPLCLNTLRVVEVVSLGILTGFLFSGVGNDTSFQGLSQRLSLFFFSTTLWTFTRMYPSVGFSYQWSLFYQVEFKKKKYDTLPVVIGRMINVLGLESLWPLIYVYICFPLAGVFGSLKIATMVALFLVLNNLCYISLGNVLGVYSKRVPIGMIASTIFSQTSLVAAGFFTKLPPALDWIRFISPFYWTFRGILKSSLKWNDTLECFKGSSEVGASQCYLEYHVAIDQYKERGINVATYNDPSSGTVYIEYTCLVALLLTLNLLIFLKAWLVCRRFRRQQPDFWRRSSFLFIDEIQSRFLRGRDDNERTAESSAIGDGSHSRMDSISKFISLAFRSGRRMVDGNEEEEEGGSATNAVGFEDSVQVQDTEPSSESSKQLRQHIMSRLQSSNILTWK